jgi:hypothetical protein
MNFQPTRRAAAVGFGAIALAGESRAASSAATGASMTPDPCQDFAFLVGRWNVAHERLQARLEGSTTWERFPGTSELWLTMGGLGTVDDNVLDIPTGTYRAMTVRAYDLERQRWAIWWLDQRTPASIDPPVYGAFKDGVGEFMGDDMLRGQPIKVRFRWTETRSAAPRWEQAFSPDGGQSWEVNWRMQFTRA